MRVARILAIATLLCGCSASPVDPAQVLAAAADLPMASIVDTTASGFGANPDQHNLLPLPTCSGPLNSKLLDATSTNSVGFKLNSSDDAVVQQSVVTFESEEAAGDFFNVTKTQVTSAACDEQNALYSEYIFGVSNVQGLPEGQQGLYWDTSYKQDLSVTCTTDPFIGEWRTWIIKSGSQISITLAKWIACGIYSQGEVPLVDVKAAGEAAMLASASRSS